MMIGNQKCWGSRISDERGNRTKVTHYVAKVLEADMILSHTFDFLRS